MVCKRITVLLVCVSLLCSLLHPVAYAVESVFAVSTQVTDDYAIYNCEDSEKVYSIIIFLESNHGQFAVKYKDDKAFVYEYVFDLPLAKNTEASDYWDTVKEICFANKDKWIAIDMQKAISCVTEEQGPAIVNSRNSIVTYCENWLAEQNGAAITDLYFSSQTYDGITFSRYFSRVHHAYVSTSYYIDQALTITAFAISVLGLAISPGLLAALGAVVSGEQLVKGSTVKQYTLRTLECYYITANGGDYPYSIADRYTYYTGYEYSATGNFAIDEASRRIVYDPSENYYLAATVQFTTAYQEYLDIGWQG